MNKLTLDLDALAVESFEPAVAVSELRGTVRARAVESDPVECPGLNSESDYNCTYNNCTAYGCTNDEQCLMATLPPKCL